MHGSTPNHWDTLAGPLFTVLFSPWVPWRRLPLQSTGTLGLACISELQTAEFTAAGVKRVKNQQKKNNAIILGVIITILRVHGDPSYVSILSNTQIYFPILTTSQNSSLIFWEGFQRYKILSCYDEVSPTCWWFRWFTSLHCLPCCCPRNKQPFLRF